MTESTNTIKYIKDPNNLSLLVVCLWIFVFHGILGIITNISIISVFNEILNGSIISDQPMSTIKGVFCNYILAIIFFNYWNNFS